MVVELVRNIKRLIPSLLYISGNLLSYRKLIIIMLVISGTNIMSFIYISYECTPTLSDLLVYSLWGYGTGYFSLIEFVRLLVTNILPVYILGIYLSNEKQNSNIYLTIRTETKKKCFFELELFSLLLIVVNVILHVISFLIIGLLLDLQRRSYSYMNDWFDFYSLNMENPLYLVVIGIMLRICELFVIQIVFLSAYSFHKNATGAFLLIMGLYTLLLLPVSKFCPVGISSLQRLFAINTNIFYAAGIVAALLLAAYLILYRYMINIGIHKFYSS